MAQLSISETIRLGDISVPLSANYQAKGNLFGERLAFTAPQTIALVTDALRWQWAGFPDIQEVAATATITIDTIGDTGQIITVEVNDPILGWITLANYTLTDSDSLPVTIADSLASALSFNTYHYGVSVLDNVITLTAPFGDGALINGVSPLINITQIGFLSTKFNDRIITQNNLNIITQ
jgi:hypothetical protein